MKQLTCEMCGSTDLLKQDGVFVCQTCGTKYSVEEAKKMMIEGKISIDRTDEVLAIIERVEQLLKLKEFDEVDKLCDKILTIDSKCAKAHLYKLLAFAKISTVEEAMWEGATFDLSELCGSFIIMNRHDAMMRRVPRNLAIKKYRDSDGWETDDTTNTGELIYDSLNSNGRMVCSTYEAYEIEFTKKAFPYLFDTILIENELMNLINMAIEYEDDTTTPYLDILWPKFICIDDTFLIESEKGVLHKVWKSSDYDGEIIIPDNVKIIGDWACQNLKNVTHIKIPESVSNILGGAFENCREIKQITIPQGVTYLRGTFSGCTSLTQVNIPNSVTEIGCSAFSGCSSLTQISIPNSVTEIGYSAFSGCSSLTQINIPEGVTQIGDSAFSGCSSLTQISIPEGVKKIRKNAFFNCSNITQINIPNSVTEIGESAFSDCQSLTQISIPEKVTKIDRGAFNGCIGLTQITIPDSVEEIGHSILTGCVSLKHVKIPHDLFKSAVNYLPLHVDYEFTNMESETDNNSVTSDDDESYVESSPRTTTSSGGGCYVATCVYGSYDCPQVWTLRRYRDDTLGSTWYGRLFIRTYYAISPTLVKWFGHTNWFKKLWKGKLDRMVAKLQGNGVEDTPYEDKEW